MPYDDKNKITASDWITAVQREAFRPEPNSQEQKVEWAEMIIAVRSLADSVRHSKDNLLTKSFTEKEVRDRMDQLRENEGYSEFINALAHSPQMYANAFKAGTRHHGGGLDDMLKTYLAMNCKLDNNGVMARFRPTAKENIETMQKHLETLIKAKDSPNKKEEILDCMSHILASRDVVGAERGGIGKPDERLNQTLDAHQYSYRVGVEKRELEKISKSLVTNREFNNLVSLAVKGHGGAMEVEVRKASDQLLEQDRRAAQEEPNILKDLG